MIPLNKWTHTTINDIGKYLRILIVSNNFVNCIPIIVTIKIFSVIIVKNELFNSNESNNYFLFLELNLEFLFIANANINNFWIIFIFAFCLIN